MKKIHLALLAALPLTLGGYLSYSASWRPRTLVQYRHGASSVAFSPDGKQVATCGGEGEVLVWDVASEKVVRTLSAKPGKANQAVFSLDGKWLAAAINAFPNDEQGETRLWDAQSGALKRQWSDERGIRGVAWAGDHRTLASSGWAVVLLMDVDGGKSKLQELSPGDDQVIDSVLLTPDGQVAVGVGESGEIFWWNRRKASRKSYFGESLEITGVGAAFSAAFSPDGRSLAVGLNNKISLYNVSSRRLRAIWPAPASALINSIAFSSDGAMLASGGQNTIELWDAASGKKLRTLLGHTKHITSLAFAPDASTLASSSADGTVRLWRLK